MEEGPLLHKLTSSSEATQTELLNDFIKPATNIKQWSS